mgnify:CR=1 FL=1
MSDNISQNELYKNKCLYVALNILLSKIQKLEKRISILESHNTNIHRIYTKNTNKTDTQHLINRLNRLETKVNEQNKLLVNKHTNVHNKLTDELDNYLQDIDDIVEFKLNNAPELLKSKK